MEWPRFHPVSSVRPLVSQFPPRSGKHETGHTASGTSPPSIHVRIAHDRPFPLQPTCRRPTNTRLTRLDAL